LEDFASEGGSGIFWQTLRKDPNNEGRGLKNPKSDYMSRQWIEIFATGSHLRLKGWDTFGGCDQCQAKLGGAFGEAGIMAQDGGSELRLFEEIGEIVN